MSTALAIAGVTAMIRDLLDSGLIEAQASAALGASAGVTARAPDLIELRPDMSPQLNLFLYQVTPNPGWRNAGMAARDAGGERIANPPLALDLHYLLTAYAGTDLHAEMLLGLGMQLLHETPVLSRASIASVLSPGNVGVPLASCGLADQVEMLKLAPEALGTEEMSRLWSAMQSRYRPSVAYKASVVLIQAQRPTRATLPVLRRRIDVQASTVPPYPALAAVATPAGGEPVALGGALELSGQHLAGGAPRLRLMHARLPAPFEFAAAAALDTRVQAVLPTQPAAIPAGPYLLSLVVDQLDADGITQARQSNPIALSVRPTITSGLGAVTRDADGSATLDIGCEPHLIAGQQISLLVGSREVFAEPFAGPTSPSARFILRDAPAGPQPQRVRLRVDGVDSALVDRSTPVPSFVPGQAVVIS